MTLVLALGVQGIADALTFSTSRSGDLETKAPNEQFTIRFSVSLKGNTAIRSGGNLIKDSTATGGAANARIDSAGYLVAEVNGREYRTIEGTPSGTLVIDPRPTYNDETPASAGTPSGTYYVDSSKRVVDSTGAAVYVQTGGYSVIERVVIHGDTHGRQRIQMIKSTISSATTIMKKLLRLTLPVTRGS